MTNLKDYIAYLPSIVTLVAAFIVGMFAYSGVQVTASNHRRVEKEKRDHVDAGVRRQVKALLKRITAAMQSGVVSGTMAPDRWKSAYYVVRNRLMKPDVPEAMADDVADAVYDALEALRVARWQAVRVEADRTARIAEYVNNNSYEEGIEDSWMPREAAEMREIYTKPCLALAEAWRLFGDEERAHSLESAVQLAATLSAS